MSSVSEPTNRVMVWKPPSTRRSPLAAAMRARLFVANDFLESEVGELKKAVSHAYTRGRFRTYTG
jgi:hypothetical protein